MFGNIGMPELGRSLGKSINEFKRASNELRNTLDEEIRVEEARSTERQRAPEPARPHPVDPPADPQAGDGTQSVPRQSSGDA